MCVCVVVCVCVCVWCVTVCTKCNVCVWCVCVCEIRERDQRERERDVDLHGCVARYRVCFTDSLFFKFLFFILRACSKTNQPISAFKCYQELYDFDAGQDNPRVYQ